MNEDKRKEIDSLVKTESKELIEGNPFAKKNDIQKIDSNPINEIDLPKEMVKEVHLKGMESIIKSDEKVQKKILEQANKTIDDEIEILKQNSNKQSQDAIYNANQEACRNYGVDESVPKWQQKLMRGGSSFWFVIYWIFASLTIAPVMVFSRGIKTFIRSTWLVIIIAVICYLLIVVGIPVIIAYFSAIIEGGY